jgi:hypothetical protein
MASLKNKINRKAVDLLERNLSKDIDYKIASSKNEFNQILKSRANTFLELYNFPPEYVYLNRDEDHYHFIGIENNVVVGSIELVKQTNITVLPIKEYIGLAKYKSQNNCQIHKLIVLDKKKHIMAPGILIALAYEKAKKLGCDNIFIAVPKKDKKLNLLYGKFGYEIIGEADYHNVLAVNIMHLDVNAFEETNICTFGKRFAKKVYAKYIG